MFSPFLLLVFQIFEIFRGRRGEALPVPQEAETMKISLEELKSWLGPYTELYENLESCIQKAKLKFKTRRKIKHRNF